MGLAAETWHLLSYAWRHPMGRHDRMGTYRRILDWQLRSRLTPGFVERPWVNDAKLCLAKGQSGATGNLYFGLHEFADMAFFAHLLRPGDVFADIGANVGSYTVLAAKVAGATVHAFEPIPQTAEALRRNCLINGISDRVTISRLALADAPGAARFTADLDATNRFADTSDDRTIEVMVETVDRKLGDAGVNAIKVDVEGAEDKVFAGAAAVLQQPNLLAIEVETLKPGVREAIEGAGFAERWYDPFARRLETRKNHLKQNNHLFVRDGDTVTERLREASPVRFGKQAI